MTHSIDSPFPPPPPTTPTTPTTSGAHAGYGTPSTADTAKDEARNVGQTAAQAGSDVASTAAQAGSQVAATAADQAMEVVHETRQQARDLVDQGRTQLREQASTQQQKAAQSLSSLVDELRSMLNGTSTSTSGPAHDLLYQATDRLENLAGWLQNREPEDLLTEARNFARRKPGTFLLGAALAGVVAGRLTRGVRAAHSDSGSGGPYRASGEEYPQTRYSQNYVEPTPAYAPVAEPAYPETATLGTAGTSTPLPPPPYGTVPPEGSVVPPATPAGWDDPTRRPGEGIDR